MQRERAGGPGRDELYVVPLARRSGRRRAACPTTSYLLGDGDRVSHRRRACIPPALAGAGAVQALSDEMTAELAADGARARSPRRSARITRSTSRSSAKASRSARCTSRPRDIADTRDVRGVDADLVVRPFGWKGTVATQVEQVAGSSVLHSASRARPRTRPTIRLAWPLGPNALGEGQLAAPAAVYLATLDTPIARPDEVPAPFEPVAWARGRAVFDDLGCASWSRADARAAPR